MTVELNFLDWDWNCDRGENRQAQLHAARRRRGRATAVRHCLDGAAGIGYLIEIRVEVLQRLYEVERGLEIDSRKA